MEAFIQVLREKVLRMKGVYINCKQKMLNITEMLNPIAVLRVTLLGKIPLQPSGQHEQTVSPDPFSARCSVSLVAATSLPGEHWEQNKMSATHTVVVDVACIDWAGEVVETWKQVSFLPPL